MKFLKNLLFVSIFLFVAKAKAQYTTHSMIFAGYEYQNQSFGELGARFLFLKNDNVLYRISGSALLGSANNTFAIMPKIQGDVLLNFEKNVDINHSYYFLAGAEATSKYIAPKIGVSIFGIIDFTGGYAFRIPNQTLNNKELKGFNVNLSLNIPLVAIQD